MVKFGDFNSICEKVALTVCPLVGAEEGIEPTCYSRNVEIAGTLIFQPATIIIHIIALIMTSIMIYHIKSKYTAVGRKEIVMFFYLYMMVTFLELLLVSGIIPTASKIYPYFTAAHIGLITATFWCLLLNGFVGFQFAEDGTPLSLWSIRISSLVIFAAVFALSLATFLNKAGFNALNPVALWIVLYIFNGAALVIYVVLQIVLVLNTLDDRWPLGDILFGISFYVIGQVILYEFSVRICDTVKHYIDGLFFGTICTLLAVMMVYKYWDSITKEDLEFSVGSKQNVWEVKEPLLGEDEVSYSNQGGYGGGYPPQQYSGYTEAY
ncbi:chitin synthase III catalytic subunit [Glomus cerebriforme]|uniref:Chitin synthase export chaperone n=1 Tax=Glomus cerebriforme TaxID=658196 RepID=A0A397T4U4_9GLOM|nr:chitin synthase III catalytic subunit [Glomus cerebriforme]